MTGLDCPGCGSQRAVHELLHGHIQSAFYLNPLFVVSLPYVFAAILFEYTSLKIKFPKLRSLLFGKTAIYIIAGVIIIFFIVRNL